MPDPGLDRRWSSCSCSFGGCPLDARPPQTEQGPSGRHRIRLVHWYVTFGSSAVSVADQAVTQGETAGVTSALCVGQREKYVLAYEPGTIPRSHGAPQAPPHGHESPGRPGHRRRPSPVRRHRTSPMRLFLVERHLPAISERGLVMIQAALIEAIGAVRGSRRTGPLPALDVPASTSDDCSRCSRVSASSSSGGERGLPRPVPEHRARGRPPVRRASTAV